VGNFSEQVWGDSPERRQLEVLDVFKAGEADERIRVAAETMYQALIETSCRPRSVPSLGAHPSRIDRRCSPAIISCRLVVGHEDAVSRLQFIRSAQPLGMSTARRWDGAHLGSSGPGVQLLH
jgi:hypothetical protein